MRLFISPGWNIRAALWPSGPTETITGQFFFGSKARPARKADNLTAVCEPIVYQCGSLDVYASTPCYGDSFTCFTFMPLDDGHMVAEACGGAVSCSTEAHIALNISLASLHKQDAVLQNCADVCAILLFFLFSNPVRRRSEILNLANERAILMEGSLANPHAHMYNELTQCVLFPRTPGVKTYGAHIT
jgi:hypothetical protein